MEFFWYPELPEHLKVALLRRPKCHLGCKLIEIWKLWFMSSKVVYTWPSYRLNTAAVFHAEPSSWLAQPGGRSRTAQVGPTLESSFGQKLVRKRERGNSAKSFCTCFNNQRLWIRSYSSQADLYWHCTQNTPSWRACTCEWLMVLQQAGGTFSHRRVCGCCLLGSQPCKASIIKSSICAYYCHSVFCHFLWTVNVCKKQQDKSA